MPGANAVLLCAGKGTMRERNWQSLKEEIVAQAAPDEAAAASAENGASHPASSLNSGDMSDTALRKRGADGSDRV